MMYNLIRTWQEISLFLVLIFGCYFPQNQSAGSYFPMFLFAGFNCTCKSKYYNSKFEINSKEITMFTLFNAILAYRERRITTAENGNGPYR